MTVKSSYTSLSASVGSVLPSQSARLIMTAISLRSEDSIRMKSHSPVNSSSKKSPKANHDSKAVILNMNRSYSVYSTCIKGFCWFGLNQVATIAVRNSLLPTS